MRKYLKQFQLSAVAVLFGLILVLTQSAFKTKTGLLYGYDPGHIYSGNTWYPLTGVSEGDNPGNYICDGAANICTATFTTPPSNSTLPPSGSREGTFALVP